jgi:chromosome segregation ATPase
MSLSEQAKTGLREMPSNAAWLLSRAVKPAGTVGSAAESVTAGVRDRERKVRAAMADATPLGGDSIEIRMKRAQDAAERAREAKERAVEAAQESSDCVDHAREVSERGRVRLKEVDRETARRVKQRVAEAQKAADEAVKQERQAAEADAQSELQEVQAEVDDAIEEAQNEAESAKQKADELLADALDKRAEAKRLAEEAAEAARAAAEEATRRARQLAHEAEQQARDAESRVGEPEQLRERSQTEAKHTARELRDAANGRLESYRKPELVELAAGIGIEGPTSMTKSELLDAIAKASRTR